MSPEDIEWVVSAADSSAADAGKVSAQEQVVPEGISMSVGPAGKDESDLLLDGDVDALFHAAEPKAFVTRARMGENFWPYGVEANAKTLNARFQYSYEQGLAKERLTVDELFHPTTLQLTES